MNTKKVAIIGGGHNGLVCAAYLLRHGFSVSIFEARNKIGGCCDSWKIDCGCTLSRGANHFGMLRPEIRKDLKLKLDVHVPKLQSVVLSSIYKPIGLPIFEFNAALKKNAEYEENEHELDNFEKKLAYWNSHATKNILNDDFIDYTAEFMELTHAATVDDLFEGTVVDDRLKNALIAGTTLYPFSKSENGSAFSLLYLTLYSNNNECSWGYVRGGMGEITDGLANYVSQEGGNIFLSTSISRVSQVDKNIMVHTKNGTIQEYDATVFCIDSERIENLCPELIPNSLVKKVSVPTSKIAAGNALKINGVLKGLPVPKKPIQKLFAHDPTAAFIFQDYADVVSCRTEAGYESSILPTWELIFPSLAFNSDSCSNHTTFSVFATPFKYTQLASENEIVRKKAVEEIFTGINQFFLGFSEQVEFFEALTPLDMENSFGISHGNVDHGDMVSEDRFLQRGGVVSKNHRTRLDRVFVGGSSSPMGGLVTGIPGYRAANVVIKELLD